MEADISTLRKTGHFYFALTEQAGHHFIAVKTAHNFPSRASWQASSSPVSLR